MRTSIVLGIIAALLLGFIVFYEHGTLSTRELEQRSGSALPELVRARVAKIEIQRDNVTTILSRDLESEDDEAGIWRVQKPYAAEADSEAVDTLLGDLEWLHGQRTLKDVSAEDRKRFGLDAPRARLWFTVGKTRVPVRVGVETPQRDGVYVEASEKNTVYIVGKDFAEALSRPPAHYHTKTLHDGLLVATARRVQVRDAEGTRVARTRPDGLWVLDEAGSEGALASHSTIKSFIEALDTLRASRYVADGKGDLARYGLAPAMAELTLMKRDGFVAKDKPQPPDILALRLRIGSACEEAKGQPLPARAEHDHEHDHDHGAEPDAGAPNSAAVSERYVTVGEGGAIFCALDADLEKLKLPRAALRETRLLPLEPEDISGVRLSRADLVLALTKKDGAWSFEQKRGASVVASGSAREGSVADLLAALRAADAIDAAPRDAVPQATEFRASFSRGESQPPIELAMREGVTEGLAQRDGEPHALAFAPATLELLEPSAAPFRSLSLLALAETSLRHLEISRAGSVEKLERAAAAEPLRVVAPVTAEADRLAASDVARLLSGLTAVRFAADSVAGEHGLVAPAFTLKAAYEASGAQVARSVSLRVGAATEGGRFASLEGQAGVFVIASQLADLLAAPLLSRTLLATPIERLATATLTQGRKSARAERTAERFEWVAQPGGAQASGSASAFVQAIATLRAQTVVSYGPASRVHGLSPRVASIELTELHDGARQALDLGGPAPQGGRYARRTGIDATFVITDSAAQALLAPLAAVVEAPAAP